jgi:predicted Zn-dependent protease
VITRRDLIRAVSRERRVADWVVIERVADVHVVDQFRQVTRRELRSSFTVVLHVDSALGRGSARITVDAGQSTATAVAARALSLATTAVGPGWRSVPPAAPARVTVEDRELPADLGEAARPLVALASDTVRVRAEISREQAAIQAKSGFHEEWPSTQLRLEALVSDGQRSLELVREARRLAELVEAGPAALAAALEDLTSLQTAQAAPTLGEPVDIVLGADALLHDNALGVWSVFAVQADATLERKGLTRYREGLPIVPGAAQVPEPLTITSDGSIDHALRSAPVGEDGDAVRKFDLVERGISAGLALTMREAALRGRDPNGGVRNLVIAPGTWDGTPVRRTIEIKRLRALSVDPYTGDASLEIALAFDNGRPFSGGTIRLDLLAALSRARRRKADKPLRRGAYVGPPAVLIERVELLA